MVYYFNVSEVFSPLSSLNFSSANKSKLCDVGHAQSTNILYFGRKERGSVRLVLDNKQFLFNPQHVGRGCLHLLRQFFTVTNIKDSVKVILKSAPNKRRLRLCLLLGIAGVVFGPMYGE